MIKEIVKAGLIKRKSYDARIVTLEKLIEINNTKMHILLYELDILRQKVAVLDGLFMLLDEEETLVMRLRFIEGVEWKEIMQEEEEALGASHDERQLQRVMEAAIDKLTDYLSSNEVFLEILQTA